MKDGIAGTHSPRWDHRMKWVIFSVISLGILLLISSSAFCGDDSSGTDVVEINGICYTLSSSGDGDTATVVQKISGYSGNVVLPDTVNYGGTDYSVRKISASAFIYCDRVKSISMSSNVTSIGERAFYMCIGLETISLSSNVTSIEKNVFCGCRSLSAVELPNKLLTIGTYSFYGCSGLQHLNIPQSVTSIDATAFCGCSGLKSFSVSSDNMNYSATDGIMYDKNSIRIVHYPAGKTDKTFTIAEKVISIEDYAFADSENLQTVNIGKDIKTVGSNAFSNCRGLTSIVIPDGVVSIGENAFEKCSNIMTVSIGAGIKIIKYGTFSSCIGLTAFTIPSNIITIEERAFYGCYHLVEVCNESDIEVTLGETSNGYVAFYAENIYRPGSGSSILKTMDCENYTVIYTESGDSIEIVTLCAYSGDITLPEFGKTSKIRTSAMMNNLDLVSVIIPECFTVIGDAAFYECTELVSIQIGNGVTDIGASAFYGCTALENITIGESVTSIKNNAFYGCESLTDVVFKAVSCEYIGSAVFDSSGTGGTGFSMTFTSNVKSIPKYFFYGCTDCNLTSIRIDDGVKTIEDYAFYDCKKIQMLYVGNTVDSIGKYSFFSSVFYDSDGTTVIEQTCKNLTGFNFSGTSSIKLLREHICVVSYYDDSGRLNDTLYKPINTVITSLDYSIRKPSTDQYDYEQTGWMYFDGKTVTYPFVLSEDISIKPVYSGTIRWYTITFYDYDDTILKTETKPYGSAIIEPTEPQRAPTDQQTYTFSGWVNKAGKQIYIPSTVSSDLSAYATYTSSPRMDGTVNVFFVLGAAIGVMVLTALILMIRKPQ